MTPFRERNPVIVGLVSMSVLAVLLVAAFRAQDLPVIGGGDTYYAEFAEAGGLQPDDEVRIAGVRVGQVKSIELADGVVRVAFQVKTDSGFGPDSRADIKVKTLLGSMYVSRWTRPAPASWRRARRSRSSARPRRSTWSRPSRASPTPRVRSTPTSWRAR